MWLRLIILTLHYPRLMMEMGKNFHTILDKLTYLGVGGSHVDTKYITYLKHVDTNFKAFVSKTCNIA